VSQSQLAAQVCLLLVLVLDQVLVLLLLLWAGWQ
jgi:hypothetical protein